VGCEGEWAYETGKGWALDPMLTTGNGACKHIACRVQGQRSEMTWPIDNHDTEQTAMNELGIIVKVVVECEAAHRTSNTFVVSSFHFAVCHQVLSLFVMQQKMILYLAGTP
jgi:hypothetical protein